MVNDVLLLMFTAFCGALCGTGFFGGLWWTIERGLQSNHPAQWFFGSMLMRTGGVMFVFAWIAQSDGKRLSACVGGFFVVRVTAQLLVRAPGPRRSPGKLLARVRS